jgi:hypothetical protein
MIRSYKNLLKAYKLASLAGLALLCALLIAGIEVMTVDPSRTSGNGNLAIVVIFPLLVILTIYLMALFIFVKESMNGKWKLLLSMILPLIILFSLAQMWQDGLELISLLGGGPSVPESRIYRFPWLNQYTNTMFFNMYLLVILSAMAIWGGAVLSSNKKTKSQTPQRFS